jgi:surface antigen
MGRWGTSAKLLFFGLFLALSCQIAAPPVYAAPNRPARHTVQAAYHVVYATTRATAHGRVVLHRRVYARGGISCVPFARSDSGISVAGNAWQWWDNAAGVYARGNVPEPGSVLTFRANGRMRLGHVAVVSQVINPREIEIEHANWWGPGMHGGVARNIPVVDVSEANDWTAVRVGLGQTGEFGSVYPTYGFIYDRPDTGVMQSASAAPAPQQELNPAPSDLRPAAEKGWQTYEEVAEAPLQPKWHRHVVHVAVRHVHRVAVATSERSLR